MDEYDHIQVKRLHVVCGTEAPREAALTLVIDGVEKSTDARPATGRSMPPSTRWTSCSRTTRRWSSTRCTR